RGTWQDKEGNAIFQSQQLLLALSRVSGRLSGMDLGPSVRRTGSTLRSIRSRSLAQVIVEAVVSDDHLDEIKRTFAWLFTTLGSCGLTGHLLDVPTIGLTADLEVVHPREIFPFPSLGEDYTKQLG